jgi:hypothetical protein
MLDLNQACYVTNDMRLTWNSDHIAKHKHKHDSPFPVRVGTGQLTDLTLACELIPRWSLSPSHLGSTLSKYDGVLVKINFLVKG